MLAAVLQVAGAVAISVGVGLLSIPAGVIACGVFAVLFGLALSRGDA